MLDRPNPPRRGAELKYIADSRLVHEFFIQLAEPGPVREIDCIESAIGDCPTGDHSCHARRSASDQLVIDAIPGNSRFQFGGDVGWILP